MIPKCQSVKLVFFKKMQIKIAIAQNFKAMAKTFESRVVQITSLVFFG